MVFFSGRQDFVRHEIIEEPSIITVVCELWAVRIDKDFVLRYLSINLLLWDLFRVTTYNQGFDFITIFKALDWAV